MVIERPIAGFSGWDGEGHSELRFSRQTLMIGGGIVALHLVGAAYLYSLRQAPPQPVTIKDPPPIEATTVRLEKTRPPPPAKPPPRVERPHPTIIDPKIPPTSTIPIKPADPQPTLSTELPPVISLPTKPAEPATTPGPKVIRNPSWLVRPSADQLNRYYPPGPLDEGLSGQAELDCQVTAAGALTACRVLNEAPSGRGFGEAALKLSRIFRMSPRTEDGLPVEGGVIRIPIRFAATE